MPDEAGRNKPESIKVTSSATIKLIAEPAASMRNRDSSEAFSNSFSSPTR
jgi:hypothetical protein